MQNACNPSKVIDLSMGEAMPSLQIRDLPEPLHRLLQHRAQAHKRSLSQQALADLEAVSGVDRRGPQHAAIAWDQTPEDLIRADRER